MITDDEVLRLFERADPARLNDVTPTICSLFGAEAKLAKGEVLRGLFG